jgi:hypothetical protein
MTDVASPMMVVLKVVITAVKVFIWEAKTAKPAA